MLKTYIYYSQLTDSKVPMFSLINFTIKSTFKVLNPSNKLSNEATWWRSGDELLLFLECHSS